MYKDKILTVGRRVRPVASSVHSSAPSAPHLLCVVHREDGALLLLVEVLLLQELQEHAARGATAGPVLSHEVSSLI